MLKLCVVLVQVPLSRRGSCLAICLNFFCWMFLSGLCSGFVSLRRAYYGLVWPFSISMFSPVAKRGKLCSGNRGLEIVIRADNSRFLTSGFPGGALLPREVESLRPLFSRNQFLSSTASR